MGKKWSFGGLNFKVPKKIRKSTEEPNCISFRKETALKNLIFEKLQDLKSRRNFFLTIALKQLTFLLRLFLLLALHLKGICRTTKDWKC